jgi:hypothetical protein
LHRVANDMKEIAKRRYTWKTITDKYYKIIIDCA